MGPKKRLRFSERKKMRSNRARAEVPQGPAYLHAPIRLAAPADDPAGRFPYLRLAAQFFRSGQFCDVGLVCGVDREAVRCQGVVLAALSGFLGRALGSAPDSGGEDAVLHLPDFDAQSVVAFLDTVYGKMEAGGDLGEEDLMPHADLVQALRIGVQEDQKPALEAVAVEYERVDVPPEKDHEEEGLAEGEEEEPREEEEFLPKVEVEDHDYDYEYDPEELKSDPEPVEVKKRKPAARRARATKRKKAGGDEGVPAKKAPIKSAAPAQFLSAKVEEIESKLKPGGVGGTLEVDVSEEPFNKTRHVPASAAFAAFLGVRRGTEDGRLTGVPLIWSTEGQLHESERFSQYEAYWKCLRAVFGFSQADAHHHHLIQAKMGLRGKRLFGVRAKSHLRNDWATHTTEQLKEVLEKEDVAAVVRRGEPKPKLDGVVGGNIVLTVDCQMPPEEAETVLVLVVPESGEVLGYEYQVPREGANMKKEAYRLVECLFHVWLQRMADQYIDRCDKIVQVYLDVQPLAVQHDIVMEFLEKDPDGSKRKDIVREKVCPTCGVVFPMNTSQDRFRFNNHKKKHFFESFQCDCPVTWKTKSAKIFHVQLVHMKGFFKCDYCSMVGRKVFSKTLISATYRYFGHPLYFYFFGEAFSSWNCRSCFDFRGFLSAYRDILATKLFLHFPVTGLSPKFLLTQ